MFFEPGTLNGISMIGTDALLEHENIPDGYYCYDVHMQGEYPDTQQSVVLRDLSNHANGSIILTEPLDFQGKAELTIENLVLYEEDPLLSLEDFMVQSQEQEQCSEQEMDQYWSQSM
jgi:hypothetical protein